MPLTAPSGQLFSLLLLKVLLYYISFLYPCPSLSSSPWLLNSPGYLCPDSCSSLQLVAPTQHNFNIAEPAALEIFTWLP